MVAVPLLVPYLGRQCNKFRKCPPTYNTVRSWAKRFNDYEHQPIVDKLTPDLNSQALCHMISVRYPELELTVSELISTGGDCKHLQSLFNEYNQLYFEGRLRRYQVLLTRDTSRCERRKRRIYINPDTGEVSVILLHEMVHAAVGRGHGKVWWDELNRLVELGAPLQEELKKYAPENAKTQKQLLPEFFDAGLDGPPDMTWAEVRCYLGYKWGATDKHGRARSRRWSRFLRSARREWSRGRVIANA